MAQSSGSTIASGASSPKIRPSHGLPGQRPIRSQLGVLRIGDVNVGNAGTHVQGANGPRSTVATACGRCCRARQRSSATCTRRAVYLGMNSACGSNTCSCFRHSSRLADRQNVPSDIFCMNPNHCRSGANPANIRCSALKPPKRKLRAKRGRVQRHHREADHHPADPKGEHAAADLVGNLQETELSPAKPGRSTRGAPPSPGANSPHSATKSHR